MGFIKHGKSLKRRKTSNKNSSSDIIALEKTPSSSKSSKLSILERFPEDILFQIFIESGPHNNLPLVCKQINKTLKFTQKRINIYCCEEEDDDSVWDIYIPGDRQYCEDLEDDVNWYNLSLVKRMIRKWYLVNLNTRLIFNDIRSKIEYYKSTIFTEYPDLETSSPFIYKCINYYIDDIEELCEKYTTQAYAYADSILLNKFISAGVIYYAFDDAVIPRDGKSRRGYGMYHIPVMTQEQIKLETMVRLKEVKGIFASISYWFFQLRQNENYEPDSLANKMWNLRQYDMFEEILPGNIELPDYDDEIEFSENCYTIYDELRECDYYDFSDILYENGINSKEKFDMVLVLCDRQTSFFININKILYNTIKNFNGEDFKGSDATLAHYVHFLFQMSPTLEVEGKPPIDEMLRLYDKFEKQDCTVYGKNYFQKSITQDLTDALLLMLDRYAELGYDVSNAWECVFELKNNTLARLLISVCGPPNFPLHS
ncbi:uncharacterized protein RJT21DRAFT_122519 [Scheffersomyces amazonensis]|uniref:uncharacterized protein n=1 Tax=Scheffersomyces amazonensis TaxID=1078765 RepID=UPI00315C52FD